MTTRSIRSDKGGIAALEFALIAPVLILVMAAIVVFGYAFGLQVAVIEAASEGARASIAGLSDTERANFAVNGACTLLQGYTPLLTPSHATVTVLSVTPAKGNSAASSSQVATAKCPTSGAATVNATAGGGSNTTVQVTYPFVNFFPAFIPLTYSPSSSITIVNGGS